MYVKYSQIVDTHIFLVMRSVILCLAFVFLAGVLADNNDVEFESTINEYKSRNGLELNDCKESEVNGDGIYFHFYSRERVVYNLTLENIKERKFQTYFHKNKVTKILVHGWHGYSHMQPFEEMVYDYLFTQNVNMMSMDWSVYSRKCDLKSISKYATKISGQVLASMMKSLLFHGANATKFHVVAFGAGAHIAGVAGKSMQPNVLGRITALNPMGLYYDKEGYTTRLETADAQLVDVIYTTNQSSHRNFGHIVFYPEGGQHPQPDIGEGVMSSSYRSISYFKRSIVTPYAYPAKRIEFSGPRPQRENEGSTYSTYDNYMGEYVDQNKPGKYYVNVRDLPVHKLHTGKNH